MEEYRVVGSIRPASLNEGRALVCVGRVRGKVSVTMKLFSSLRDPPGGTFGFSKLVFAPSPKTWPKIVFIDVVLIGLSGGLFCVVGSAWATRAAIVQSAA
jgi:hypothetical protein